MLHTYSCWKRAAHLVAVVLAAATLTLVQADAARAGSHAQGIADSGAGTFSHPLWHDLNVIRARVIVPYNIALRPDGDARRKKFQAWLDRAEAARLSVNVGLARITDPENLPGYQHAPDERTFRTAFRAFVAAYGTRVDVIGPWNEPNYRPVDGSRAFLPGGKYSLDESAGCDGPEPRVADCGPRMAAYYYRWAAVDCPTCRLAAGEFAGTTDPDYIQKYKLHLGRHRPALWSVHNYADVIRYQVGGDASARELQSFLRELYCTHGHHCVPGRTDWSSGHLWIGATGAYYQLDCKQHSVPCDPGKSVHVLGEVSQCRAAAFINRLSDLSQKITRIYFYAFTDGRSGDNTGLIDMADKPRRADKPRQAYEVVRTRAPSCPR